MAGLGKEKIFFLVTLLILAFLTYSLITSPHTPVAAPAGEKPSAELLASVEVPWSPRDPIARGDWLDLERDPFLEPRDWLPLPPANLPRPPVSAPAQVPPYPVPALGMDHRGQYRVVAEITPHEFAEGGTEAAVTPDEAPDEAIASNGSRAAPPDDGQTLEQSFRARFDWIETTTSPRPMYGIILNEDKYTLGQRADEEVMFRQIDPQTNRLRAEGAIPRAQIKDNGIHLADTPVNRVERKILEIPESTWNAGAIPRLVKNVREVMAEGAEDPYAWQRAAEELTKYQQIDPLVPDVYELLADCHRHLFDYEAELATLRSADEAGVTSGGLVMRKARWFWRYGARAHALALLAEGVKLDAVNRELRLFRGQCFLAESMGNEARAEFDAAEKASATPAERREVLRMFGEALLALGESADALTQAERIFAIDADDSEGLGLAGAAHYALGQFEEASRAYGRLLEVAGDDPVRKSRALIGQGLSMIHLGQFDAARHRLQRAGQENPLMQARAEAGLAFLYEVTASPSDALEHALSAVEMAPSDPTMHYFVGRQLRLAGDLEGAQEKLREALAGGATFSDLFNELGFLAMLQDQAGDAVRYLEESLQREDRTETRNLLGHAHLVADDLPRARRAFADSRNSSETFAGIAFCDYMSGKSADAQERFQSILNDMDNARPQDRSYAEAALGEILDRESKERWEDLIRWRQVGNGWTLEERFGLSPRVDDGRFSLKGTQRAGSSEEDWTYLQRPLELATFHELEMELVLEAANQGRVGMALVAWGRGVGQVPRARTAVCLAVDPDGTLRVQKRENLDDPRATWEAVGNLSAAAGEPFTVTLRREEQGSDRFQFRIDGADVGEEIEMPPWRGKRKQQLFALFFAVAEPGRKVEASMTAARMIRFRE